MILGLRYVVCIAIALIIACTSDQYNKRSSKVINPNGDSELALLMREMFDDGMETKRQILAGEAPEISVKYHDIRSVEATEPEKVASTDYLLYAKAYEASVDSLLASPKDHRGTAYQTMVGACINCHQAMCPGPMVKIKKMYLSDTQLADLSAN